MEMLIEKSLKNINLTTIQKKMDLLNWYTKRLYQKTKANHPDFIKKLEDYLYNS